MKYNSRFVFMLIAEDTHPDQRSALDGVSNGEYLSIVWVQLSKVPEEASVIVKGVVRIEPGAVFDQVA